MERTKGLYLYNTNIYIYIYLYIILVVGLHPDDTEEHPALSNSYHSITWKEPRVCIKIYYICIYIDFYVDVFDK